MELKVGPVLSYRGLTRKDGSIKWKVSAMIGVSDNLSRPKVRLDGVDVGEPVLLADRGRDLSILRYDLTVELGEAERRVAYSVDGVEGRWEFTVPGKNLDVRSAYVSCNGFSDPDAIRKLAHKAGAVWHDLVMNHDRTLQAQAPVDKEQLWHLERGIGTNVQRFHVLMMGGDQMYFDSIWQDIDELKEWADLGRAAQLDYKVSAALRAKINRYYFSKYCERWLKPSRAAWDQERQQLDSADAMARIPTIMMWDDHDIFDGWGSYSPEMQACPVMQTLFDSAREAFWVYQLQHTAQSLPLLRKSALQVIDAPQFAPIAWSQELAGDPLALPLLDGQPGFSSTADLGKVSVLVLDLRTERARKQIMGNQTWKAAEQALGKLDPSVNHVLVMASVPVAHPKLSVAETMLDIFGTEHVVDSSADDLKDHWSHDDHEPERKRLTRMLVNVAQDRRVRVGIVSGDVHVAAWGILCRNDVAPDKNWLRIEQFTSSAVVHPAPAGPIQGLFVKYLNSAAAQPQAIDTEYRCEMMQFPGHNRYIMAARNWLALEPDPEAGGSKPRLWATWRCEGETGFSNHLVAMHPAEPGQHEETTPSHPDADPRLTQR